MKKLIVLIAFLLPGWFLLGQSFDYGNQWYKAAPNQPYVKLVVEQDGVYRVTLADLQAAGHDLSGVNPQNLRLYYRGKEVPLFVTRNAGQLVFLEFFGEQNDGRIDSLMYRDPISGVHDGSHQPTKDFSLFTDESAYFLTWGNTPSGNRYFSLFNPTYSLYTPVDRIRYEARKVYPPEEAESEYVRGGGGPYDSFYTLNSDYITGEGYLGPPFGYNSPLTAQVSTPAALAGGSQIEIQTRVYGRSNTQHILRVSLNGNTSSPVLDTAWQLSKVYIKTYQRFYTPPQTLGATTDLTYQALRANTDNNNLAWASITYDRQPNMAGDSLLRVQAWDKPQQTYLRLTNAVGTDSVYVYDLRNRFRNVGLMNGSTAQVIVQGFPNSRELIVATDAAVRKPRIESASLNKLFGGDGGAEYVIIAHRDLAASATAYAAYRDTATRTPINGTKVVYMDEIYDEYGYGSVTSWAIKRFCKDALDNWPLKPRYFLLWGKGKFQVRGFEDLPLVPTFGYPATDYEFVAHFNESSNEVVPEAAIGRVNLFTNDEGFAYLEKVKAYESMGWEAWLKEGVFLGGGATLGEQTSIQNAFANFIEEFSSRPYGGFAHTYFKTNSNIIDPEAANYHEEISEGVAILHFFGHSTSNIQDISIRQAFEYNNYGRPPFMIAMGCYGGDFTVGRGPGGASFGENWVKYPERGAIGYLANSSAGYLLPLRSYGEIFYPKLYQELLGQPVGIAIQKTLTLYADSLRGVQTRNHGRQLNLQGDPAVILANPPAPDLAVDETSIFFTPANFSAQDDSFTFNLIISNNGLVTEDSFDVTIRQRLPTGEVFDHPGLRLPMVAFRDTFTQVLDNPVGNLMTGQNTFEVFVDASEEVEEYDETNNRISRTLQVPGNIPAVLYPAEFAIIGESQVELKASATFITRSAEVSYVFEIDTVASFDSPLLTNSGVVTGGATLASWAVPFSLSDSTVYFWRVRLSEVTPVVWAHASFKYIANREGWAQAKLDQFYKNRLDTVELDLDQRKWRFDNFGSRYEFAATDNGYFFYVNNGNLVADVGLNGFYGNGVAYVVIDQFTLLPKLSTPQIGPVGAARAPEELYKLKNVILNAQQGDYVIVGSNRNPNVHLWPDDAFETLELIGASANIRQLQDGDPFLIVGRKGYPNSAIEVFTPSAGNKLSVEKLLLSRFDRGSIFSTRIGPALDWQSLLWDWESQDQIVQEAASVEVYGIRQDQSDSLIFRGLPTGQTDLSSLNPQRFPYLELRAVLEDTLRRTPPVLDNWHVLYTPAPDAVIDPLIDNFAFESDTIYEGQDVFLRMGARNITPTTMDSMLVTLAVERADRSRLMLDSVMLPPLTPNGPAEVFEFRFNSADKNLSGLVNLIVELNPGMRQPEQYFFNNLYLQPFFVVNDRINPIVDVTFDGKHIIDGDIVSPRPEILVEVNDENAYIALEDTSAFDVDFKVGNSWLPVSIGEDPRIEWQPASLPDNKARLYFRPGLNEPLADGRYSLRVMGRDASGNQSGLGNNFYEINFEVISESSITQIVNYPNPFSTSTRFVYTLTGQQTPEVFQIHIYTITGKLVKVVDLMALGDVFIGRNITNYAWDGTDEYGDRLANGVYLYRVVTRMSGEETLEKRDVGIDRYFNNGWGKMYLMR